MNAVKRNVNVFLERPLWLNSCHSFLFISYQFYSVLFLFGCYNGQVSFVKEIPDLNGTAWLNKAK